MAQITKELLQRLETSIFKETAIRKDAQVHYFYFSLSSDGATAIGTTAEIDVSHIYEALRTNAEKMYTISIADCEILVQAGGASIPLYIDFPQLEPTTRYHFAVGFGFNQFNNSNNISLVCSDFPHRYLTVRYGYRAFSAGDEQQQEVVFTDLNPSAKITNINIRFKVQSITLN